MTENATGAVLAAVAEGITITPSEAVVPTNLIDVQKRAIGVSRRRWPPQFRSWSPLFRLVMVAEEVPSISCPPSILEPGAQAPRPT